MLCSPATTNTIFWLVFVCLFKVQTWQWADGAIPEVAPHQMSSKQLSWSEWPMTRVQQPLVHNLPTLGHTISAQTDLQLSLQCVLETAEVMVLLGTYIFDSCNVFSWSTTFCLLCFFINNHCLHFWPMNIFSELKVNLIK